MSEVKGSDLWSLPTLTGCLSLPLSACLKVCVFLRVAY